MEPETIRKIVMGSKATNCLSDPIPSKFIKDNVDIVLPLIVKITNISLLTGKFSEEWKTAFVLPLLKKIGMELINKSYRPVSNLSFLSKIVEKSGLVQFVDYMDENHLQPNYLSAYRKYFSTETALMKLHNDILTHLDDKMMVLMTMIDLSAAFDTVDHDILLDVMDENYAVKGLAYNWFDTYLRPRNFKTFVNDAVSEPKKLPFSVPQGSCAGPVLYNVYASTLENLFKESKQKVLGYADDHSFYDSFDITTYDSVKASMENKLDEVKQWMTSNRLKMNDEKTEVIIFGSNYYLSKLDKEAIRVGYDNIEVSEVVKYLGAWLDSKMTMSRFITEKCKSAHFHLHNIRQMRRSIDMERCKTLVHSLIISQFDYANALLYGLPDYEIEKLYRIQCSAAKLILNRHRRCSNDKALFDLHWLPISYRIKHKILCMVYKCLHNEAPEYLSSLLEYKKTDYQTRTEDNLDLVVPKTTNSYGDRSFRVCGPKLWNSTPTVIRKSETFDIFKNNIKTYLFREAFPDLVD